MEHIKSYERKSQNTEPSWEKGNKVTLYAHFGASVVFISTKFNATKGIKLIYSFISVRPEHSVDNLFQIPAAYDFHSLKTLRS